jgi:hypothetical protein
MIDYGQLIWKKILERERKAQHHQKKAFGRFDRTWMARNVFGRRIGDRVVWRQRLPDKGLIIHSIVH